MDPTAPDKDKNGRQLYPQHIEFRKGGNRLAYHKLDCACNACKNKPRRPTAGVSSTDDTRERPEEAESGPAGSSDVPAPEALILVEEGSQPNVPLAIQPPQKLSSEPMTVLQSRDHKSRIAHWILLKTQGKSKVEAAKEMGIQVSTLNTLISKAVKAGWLVVESPEEKLEHEIGPLVADVVKYHLERKSEKMAIEAAKGLGYFKSHQAIKTENEVAQTNLQLNIQINAPEGETRTAGNAVGVPKLTVFEATPIEDKK